MNRSRLLLCSLVLLAPTMALGGTVRMKSGELLEGKVTDAGDRVLVSTGDGEVSVRWRDVDVVLNDRTPADLFREKLAATDLEDAAAVFALALWAERAGLQEERADCLAKVLALDPDHAGAQSELNRQKQDGKWRSGADLLTAKGFVASEGRWVLAEEARMLERRGEAAKSMSTGEKRVEELLAKAATDKSRARAFALEALAGLESSDKLRPALRMLRRGEPLQRQVAAEVLGALDDVDVVRPLIYAAIMDRDATVRATSVKALVALDNPDVVKPFARALWSGVPQVRMNAVEGLGAIGGSMSVQYIIRRVQSTGGIGNRNHFTSMSQLSYVSDFDVEIAQAAQIGDPIVGTLREGVSLDTRVLGVREEWTEIERHVFYGALRTATGKDFGEDAKAWKRWWDEEGATAMADPQATPGSAAGAAAPDR